MPRWLDRIIRKCLSVDPEGRYPSMTEVAAIFEKHQPGRHQKRSFESALKALQIKKEPDPLDIRTALQALRAWDQALFVAEDYSALVDELYPAAKILEPYLTSLELAGILYRHGRVLARTGHITDAANFFSDAEALVEGRHDLDTLKLRASIYLDSAYFSGLGVMKDYLDKTLKVFQEIEARNPDQLMKQIAALKSRLSESRASSLEVEASDIEAVDVSLIHISDFIDPILRGRFWYLKAILARKDKNYEQAHEFAKKAQAILHGDYQWTVNIQALIGYIYIDQKDFDKAIEMLNQLRRTIEASETIAHNGMAVYVNLGEALYRSDRFEEAQEVLEVGLYEYGDQRYMAELYKYLFLVYLKMNNFEKAQNIFNKRKGDKGDLFVELQDPIAQLTFARMSQVNREYTMAEQVFYSLKDNDSLDLQHRLEVYDSLAAIYIQLKKTAELKAEIEELKNICQDTSIPKKERLLFFELAQSLEKKCFEMED
ncbi:MAG: hypothetical protein IPJ69_14240 [Deltaproteobacteria bacterium]|nr:MAG: hypothetical protein IPJ69_14240 [Deltaproteobacteria bacterium]